MSVEGNYPVVNMIIVKMVGINNWQYLKLKHLRLNVTAVNV